MSGVESLSPQAKVGRPAAARRVFGVKATLFLAFCGMAALAVIASAVLATTVASTVVTHIRDQHARDKGSRCAWPRGR
jgi:hypothetical protein